MSTVLVIAILISVVSAQFYDFEQIPQQYYHPNSIQYDYIDDGSMYYALPQQYQHVQPYYQMIRPQPKMSYSKQIMRSCGCEQAKTYSDYLKYREYIRRQNKMMMNYYNMFRM